MNLPHIQLRGGLSCSIIGLGTMGFGGQFERDESNDTDAIQIIHRALDFGVNLFDTGEVYAAGHCEEVLGQALLGRRDKALIASKFKPENSSKQRMIAACEGSLKRLNTDVIDIYQMHWPNPAVPIEEMAAGFEHLVNSGKIRAIGFSNATSALMQRFIDVLPADFPVATTQQDYNLTERFVERAILPFCQSNNLALLAYSPLAHGKLLQGDTGKKLSVFAKKHNTTSAALALQWLAQKPMTISIPMTLNSAHLKENIMAVLTPLSMDITTELRRAFQITIAEIPVKEITVIGSHTGKNYSTLADAKANTLNLSPSPVELSHELAGGEMLKPVKVRKAKTGGYELHEGQLRYWAWRIAHDDKLPIPALIDAT